MYGYLTGRKTLADVHTELSVSVTHLCDKCTLAKWTAVSLSDI